MKKLVQIVLITVCIVVMNGCFEEKKEEKTIHLKSLGWVIENLDEGAFGYEAGCYYNFWIHYEGEIELSEIEYAKVKILNNSSENGGFWTLNLIPKYFNKERKVVGGWTRNYLNSNRAILPIGKLEAEIKLKNGTVSKIEREVPAPGSLTSGNYKFVYNSEQYTSSQSEYVPNLKRAKATKASKSLVDEEVQIEYNVNDNKVFNGAVYFYDNFNNFVGAVDYFRDIKSQNVIVSSFDTTGINNILVLKKTDISFETGKEFKDIYKCYIILYDGKQYLEEEYMKYDCSSVSSPIYF